MVSHNDSNDCNHDETVMRSTRSGIRFEAIIMRDSYIEEYP